MTRYETEHLIARQIVGECSAPERELKAPNPTVAAPQNAKNYVVERLRHIDQGQACHHPQPGCSEIVQACVELWCSYFNVKHQDALNEAMSVSESKHDGYMLVAMPNFYNWMIDTRIFEEHTPVVTNEHILWDVAQLKEMLYRCVRPYRVFKNTKLQSIATDIAFATDVAGGKLQELILNFLYELLSALVSLSQYSMVEEKNKVADMLVAYFVCATPQEKVMRFYQTNRLRTTINTKIGADSNWSFAFK